ncbi:MAG: YceI family protein [Myxococcaceae bacterium]
MSRYDASNAQLFIYTFKEGALAAIAHDLKLTLGRFEIDAEGDTVTATFDATTIKVVCPRKDGRDNPGVLPQMLYGEIEKNAKNDVLEVGKHASVKFKSTVITESDVRGELTLHGKTAPVTGTRSDDATHRGVSIRFDQRDFGIKPYSAMLGTLKIKPEVVVEVRLPK